MLDPAYRTPYGSNYVQLETSSYDVSSVGQLLRDFTDPDGYTLTYAYSIPSVSVDFEDDTCYLSVTLEIDSAISTVNKFSLNSGMVGEWSLASMFIGDYSDDGSAFLAISAYCEHSLDLNVLIDAVFMAGNSVCSSP